jgi:RecA/RadA recombinase
VSFCKEVDELLGGGAPLGELLEVVGAPGTGKTTLAVQLALDVQILPEFGGCGGAALFIDTEGSFDPRRAATMAAAVHRHMGHLLKVRRGIASRLPSVRACGVACMLVPVLLSVVRCGVVWVVRGGMLATALQALSVLRASPCCD